MARRRGGRPFENPPSRPLAIYFSTALDPETTVRDHDARTREAQLGTHYPAHFLEVCEARGLEPLLIGSRRRNPGDAPPDPRARYWSDRVRRGRGPFFVAGQAFQMLRLAVEVLRRRPRVLVVCDQEPAWFPLALAGLVGTEVVLSFHCTIWPLFGAAPRWVRPAARAHKWFLGPRRKVLAVSDDVARQVIGVNPRADVRVFLPTYERALFDDIAPPVAPSLTGDPFEMLFVGRVTENKGVLDLVTMLADLRADGIDANLHVCGTGSAEAALADELADAGLADAATLHGHSTASEVLDHLAGCHAVIVPTHSTFTEGFNRVVTEAVLAHRPVVTSPVCPAIHAVGDAAMEAEPDDVESYRAALHALATDADLYATKVAGAASVRERFLDPGNSWAAHFDAILDELLDEPRSDDRESTDPGCTVSDSA